MFAEKNITYSIDKSENFGYNKPCQQDKEKIRKDGESDEKDISV